MSYRLAIFDLDGTILDTLEDLKESTNAALAANGYPERTLEEVRCFVGNGIGKLIERAVPKGTSKEATKKTLESFKVHYGIHCADHTKPYDGIIKLLEDLRKCGIQTAVVSNKADFAVQELCSQYFPKAFDFVVGEREGIRRKPCPDSVFEVLKTLKKTAAEAVYIGDSDVDVDTAKEAGMDGIFVNWGFRGREFLLEHGFVDRIVERHEQKKVLTDLLHLHSVSAELKISSFAEKTEIENVKAAEENIQKKYSAWDRVCFSRDKKRPIGYDYINALIDQFYEFHGDRIMTDDKAVTAGIGFFNGQPVTVIAQEKNENFGMCSPQGYRKALRLMRQAEKFHRPILCFVDTPGAACGIEAEEHGQGEAIARNLFEMSSLKTPILSILIGEGGSGGALALSVGNEVWMLENATYSVLSPEGFASILWKDGKRAKEASEVMKITAHDLYALNIVEQVIPEYGTADEKACESISRYMKGHMKEFLERQNGKTGEQLAEEGYARFRAF